jgi:hypothetical protein
MLFRPIDAHPGAEIRPAFEAAQKAATALQPRPGANSLLSLTPLGFTISGRRKRSSFAHPFAVHLAYGRGGGGVRIANGRVTLPVVGALEPVIKVNGEMVPITGQDRRTPPTLRLEASVATEAQESWVCVEVVSDEDGNFDEKTVVEVVHRSAPTSNEKTVGRHPLALILWLNGKPGSIHQCTHFNLRYVRTTPSEGMPQHLFL